MMDGEVRVLSETAPTWLFSHPRKKRREEPPPYFAQLFFPTRRTGINTDQGSV